eukprot:scaffold332076_cov15-Prasinocladus_malaysianus.AAC.1
MAAAPFRWNQRDPADTLHCLLACGHCQQVPKAILRFATVSKVRMLRPSHRSISTKITLAGFDVTA